MKKNLIVHLPGRTRISDLLQVTHPIFKLTSPVYHEIHHNCTLRNGKTESASRRIRVRLQPFYYILYYKDVRFVLDALVYNNIRVLRGAML